MSTASDDLDQLDVENFFKLVEKNIGIDLDLEKTYLITSRLTHLVQQYGFSNHAQLLRHLVTSPAGDLHRQAFEAMTTNETSFFRDVYPFDALQKTIIPALIARCEGTREIQIWSAASSTGQEPYSIAILLRENFPELAKWKIQILATDISQHALDKAMLGIYNPVEIARGLSESQKNRHFTKLPNGHYQVHADIRSMVEFKQMNLIQNWLLMPKFDLILIRNVLIYFNQETKAKIVKKLHAQLPHADAFLMLGSSESILFDKAFKAVQLDRVSYYQKEVP
jgi:chemotaxis protein methyltransferase CheR